MDKSIIEALEIISGGKSGGYYIAGFFFSLLSIILSIYLHSRKRDPASPHTPQKFSWSFLIWDNGKRMVVGLIVMFILFRLFDLSNVFAMVGAGFFVSFGLDKVIEFLMEKTNIMNFLKTDREKFNQKP
jgi:hypothetical protein